MGEKNQNSSHIPVDSIHFHPIGRFHIQDVLLVQYKMIKSPFMRDHIFYEIVSTYFSMPDDVVFYISDNYQEVGGYIFSHDTEE